MARVVPTPTSSTVGQIRSPIGLKHRTSGQIRRTKMSGQRFLEVLPVLGEQGIVQPEQLALLGDLCRPSIVGCVRVAPPGRPA